MQLPALQVEIDPSHRDAESRAAAVRALSSVAQELFPVSRPSEACHTSDSPGVDADSVLERVVLGPLLQAACDYCTDDRCAAPVGSSFTV